MQSCLYVAKFCDLFDCLRIRRRQNRQVERNFSVDDFKIRYLSISHSISFFHTLSHNILFEMSKTSTFFSALNFCSSSQSFDICVLYISNQIQTDMQRNDSSRSNCLSIVFKYIGFSSTWVHCATLVRVHAKREPRKNLVRHLCILFFHRSFSLFSLSFYFHKKRAWIFLSATTCKYKTLYKYD